MKTTIFAIALMASGAAVAQTYPETTDAATRPVATTAASGQVQLPSNEDPEHDARGIAVISDPAAVPAGFNGSVAPAVGGPYEPVAADASSVPGPAYPACSRTVTDNCLQAYERGRSPD